MVAKMQGEYRGVLRQARGEESVEGAGVTRTFSKITQNLVRLKHASVCILSRHRYFQVASRYFVTSFILS